MKPHALIAATLACMALASCAQTPAVKPALTSPAPAPSADADSETLAQELHASIGPAACSADAQCRTVAMGAKACGGPAAYLAWSTKDTDAARVAELAERQALAQRREIQASGLRSNCAFVADPGASCVAGRCQLSASPALR